MIGVFIIRHMPGLELLYLFWFCYGQLWVMVLVLSIKGFGVGTCLSILLSCGFVCLVLFVQHHLSYASFHKNSNFWCSAHD
jgi:hypothetical protein